MTLQEIQPGDRAPAIVAGILFIVATTATIADQILLAPILSVIGATDIPELIQPTFTLGVLMEMTNALASAGIAIAMFPILKRCDHGAAIAYVSIRAIEGCMGVAAAASLLTLRSVSATEASGLGTLLVGLHDWLFIAVLIVFSIGTLILYPTLYRFKLVPSFLSIWGLLGGLMLLAALGLILFAQIASNSTPDMILSFPIMINEMALAAWLIFKGVQLPANTH